MADAKKVAACKKCCGFDVAELKTLGLKVKDTKTTCIGMCRQNEGKFWGKINDELVVCDTKDEFFSKVKAAL